MTGFVQGFDWDDKDVQRMLGRMVENAQDMTRPMKEFAQYMLNEATGRFEREEDPWGKGWVKLSDSTLKQREKAGKSGKKLQVDGILKGSLASFAEATSAGLLVDGSNLEYAAIQNFGGEAGPGHKVLIPARQFVGFNDDDIEEFMQTVRDWVLLQGGNS